MFFKDLKDTHWAYKAISEMCDVGIMNGYEDKTFRPDNLLTRAECIAVIVRECKNFKKNHKYDVSMFSDVDANAWYANYIGFAYANGIINGYEDGMFHPDSPITRAEVATIKARTEAW